MKSQLPFALKEQLYKLRKIWWGVNYSKEGREAAFFQVLNRISRLFDEDKIGCHFVVFNGLVYMLPNDVYARLMEYHSEYVKAVKEAKDYMDGYEESNDVNNYQTWIMQHYAPVSIESDNLDRDINKPVEVEELGF